MARNIIVSEDTVRALLEAQASLAAWYHELSAALRAKGVVPHAPPDARRAECVAPLLTEYPDLASVVRQIHVPRLVVPPPLAFSGPTNPLEDPTEPSTLVEPAPARARDSARPEAETSAHDIADGDTTPGPSFEADSGPPPSRGIPVPPPRVNPAKVRY